VFSRANFRSAHQKDWRVASSHRLSPLGQRKAPAQSSGRGRSRVFTQPKSTRRPFWTVKALALLSTGQSADIVLPTTDGREIRLRHIREPSAEQKSLLPQLGLTCRSNSTPSQNGVQPLVARTDSERFSPFRSRLVTNFGSVAGGGRRAWPELVKKGLRSSNRFAGKPAPARSRQFEGKSRATATPAAPAP
jgi:hypothetical protein